ncbi:glycosyltransferase family 4 protein [Paenibacillus radicis (ex Xue et al. 2023)]|uniref:Glycosyltransferase family 4 protein n=1 Tax=Paenibacillus radicis (ex Xue et al. 2023) TaxID=2972489 RepID=A0ABT1YS30_9BACL|nr:glycosyltransferase family 4 protein [Paenibacillus radicis (ex Xue et al. 2023)]MCR8635979.1 glycosyltransferase family 4 protein [Paenibacillus radicis (ex Xue et al. 2023)]
MKIAYFSPLNPQKSGISDYSEYLLEALMDKAEIDVWVEGFIPSNEFINTNFKIYDYVSNPEILVQLKEYDEIIYNIGNNPYYHTHIYNVFLKYNGIVILHEYVLYYLVTGYLLEYHNNPTMYLEELFYNDDYNGYNEGLKILSSEIPPLQYKNPENLPLNKRLIHHARGIIVHSEYAKLEVLRINPFANCITIGQIGPNTEKIKLSNMKKNILKKKWGIKNEELIIASFGYISPTKRIHHIIKALAQMDRKTEYKYLMVGEGDYVNKLIKKYNLEDKVILTGFTNSEEFDELIDLSDIVINLRYPYMGETSAALIRALLLGKATIVSDIGWFGELPNDIVIKIPINEKNEVTLIKDAIQLLARNNVEKNKLEMNAITYANNYLNPHVISNDILKFTMTVMKRYSEEKIIYFACDKICEVLDVLDATCYDSYIDKISKTLYDIFVTWEDK